MYRHLFHFLLLSAFALSLSAQVLYAPAEARNQFEQNRFGIFLHWGLYATFAQGEWYMTNADIDCSEYAKAAEAFYPHRFDANAWVRAIKASGAKYICFTSRHHDGFSMWDTRASDYNIMHTPYQRDVVGSLAQACHEQGMPLHLYYSLIDWTRPDYPRGRTGRGTGAMDCGGRYSQGLCEVKPQRPRVPGLTTTSVASGYLCPAPPKPDWQNYYAFMRTQLEELLTNYGNIGCIWFDGWWDHDQDSIPFSWEFEGLYNLIHQLQPNCLVGNNHHQIPFPGEDIQIFERDVPGENKAGLSGQSTGKLPLETCQTMNGMWGYKVKDQNYKSSAQLISLLCRTAAKGANLLLNIGPQPDGSLPEAALSRLDSIGKWLSVNGNAIYGTKAGGFSRGEDIVSTGTQNHLYLHILTCEAADNVSVPLVRKPRAVSVLSSGKRLPFVYKDRVVTLQLPASSSLLPYVIEICK